MSKKLFVLDAVPLVYRAYFAMIKRPVLISTGLNTSAILVFMHMLLDILQKHQPTHLAAAFDADAPWFGCRTIRRTRGSVNLCRRKSFRLCRTWGICSQHGTSRR